MLKLNFTRMLVLGLIPLTSMAAVPAPAVKVTGGTVQGLSTGDSGAAFKGIPFAAPPVGDLRWREPAPVVSWTGVRDATRYSASCVQAISEWNRQEAIGNQEDCLYLNVWTNEWPAKTRKPVMVWIYGGGNTAGGASVDYFDGASLARKGVVLVTFNYRMGFYGFFAHPALAAENSHHSSGNYTLLDHQAALRWVRDNIAQFGGDPNNVTLFGQSAGSANTNYQLASALSKGLFHKAIQQSGAGIRDLASGADAAKAGERFVASLKLPAGKEGIKALRAMPAEELRLKAVEAAKGENGPTMAPSVDGYVLTTESQLAMLTGKQHAVPLLIGSNAQEQGGPQSLDELRKQVASVFGANTDKALVFYGLNNGGEGKSEPLYGSAARAFQADTNQRCQSTQAAIWHAAIGQPVYLYQYDHAIAGQSATRHSAEVPYLFGNLLSKGFLSGGPYTDVDRNISADLQTYWTNFAKTSDPNSAGIPKWEKFDAMRRAMIEFTDNGPVAKEGLRRDICDLYMESLRHHLAQRK